MVENRKKRERRPWFRKLIVGALMWLASKVFEPIPVVGALIEIVAFAV